MCTGVSAQVETAGTEKYELHTDSYFSNNSMLYNITIVNIME